MYEVEFHDMAQSLLSSTKYIKKHSMYFYTTIKFLLEFEKWQQLMNNFGVFN